MGVSMADSYKKTMDYKVGPGGVHCQCCNAFFGKEKPLLNRLARRILKREIKTEIENGLIEFKEEENYEYHITS